MSALKAQTIDAAWQIFQEAERGSIVVGKLADLVIPNETPLDHPENLANITVQQTIRRGQNAYDTLDIKKGCAKNAHPPGVLYGVDAA